MSSQMKHLLLFTTAHCHLCDAAEQMLMSFDVSLGFEWQPVEISDDDALIALYGVRIPVVKRTDNNVELNWPFSAYELEKFILDKPITG